MKTIPELLGEITGFFIASLIVGLVVYLAWNHFFCTIFTNLPMVGYWGAWGVGAILKIIQHTFK